jgi:L-threonylcarbamoyladenylate synthase
MRTQVVKINRDFPEPEKVRQAVSVLERGGLVAFPTETVYGLGANFNDKKAVTRLYDVKDRPKEKPFSLLIGDMRDIDSFAYGILPVAYRLADRFWPGPLTLVLKSKDYTTIGLRMPKSPVALEITKNTNFPIACPSANLSGGKSPLDAKDVLDDLDGKIELLLDGGKVELGISSTVADVSSLPVKILREGYIDKGEIMDIASKKRILFVCTGNSCRSVMAQALFEKKLKEKGRNDIEVFSAGISAPIGIGASNETRQLLKEEGIDVSGHRAQRTSEEMYKRSDLILVMQRFQEETISRNHSFLKGRVYLLKEFSKFDQNNLEIEDPIGRGMDVYKRSFYSIKEAIDRLVDLV